MLENIVQNKSTDRQLIFLAIDIIWKLKYLKESSISLTTDEKIDRLVELADRFTEVFENGIAPKSSRKGK